MGRLFWKLFVAFWLCLLVAGGVVGLVTTFYQDDQGEGPRQRDREKRVGAVAALLQYGGESAVRQLLAAEQDLPPPDRVRVVDANGKDLSGLMLLPQEQDWLDHQRGRGGGRVILVKAASGAVYQVFAPEQRFDGPGGPMGGPPHGGPPSAPKPWVPLLLGLLGSIGFSALVAWYLASPIRNLRTALDDVAAGKLDTRVHLPLTARSDELGDLGRDFDRMARQLEALVSSQRRLLHDVSHEIRSPLARLQTAIGIIRQNPERQADMLDRLELESGRLDHLVGELLVLSRLQSGTVHLRKEQVDLVDLVAGICDDARFEGMAKGRSVLFAADNELFVMASPELIGRALENIIRNAVKFTRENTSVEVRVFRVGDKACIDVMDAGKGVPEEELPMIFVPFFRGAEGVVMNGTGLGLAIASRAIEAHGGRVTASNRSQGGLHVRIELPTG